MQELKIGVLIRILQGDEPYFKAGTLARLSRLSSVSGWRASFEDCGNEPDAYMCNHRESSWPIGEFGVHFELANLEK